MQGTLQDNLFGCYIVASYHICFGDL